MSEQAQKTKKNPKRAAKEAAADKYVKITLVRSLIGFPKTQRDVARGLGLRKLGSHVVRRETPEISGMVRRISHVLDVSTVEKP